MLTKTLRFDNDVLDAIRSMNWENDGRLGILNRQLDRALYQKVNKALESMGGKWNRKSGGHVFLTDPRPQVEGLLDSGTLQVERDGFFQTPPAVIERMFALVPPVIHPYALYLEPEGGMGAIIQSLIAHGITPDRIVTVEKNEQRAAHLRTLTPHTICGDFLNFQHHPGFRFDRIYMNPPFEEGQDIRHVMHAYELLGQGGKLVAVMCEGVFFREDHKSQDFRHWLDEVGGYSEALPPKSFHESGTDVNARLVVIQKRG